MYSPTKKSVTPKIFAALIGLTVTASLAACSNNDEDDNNPELGKTTDASVSESTEFVPASEDGPAQNVPEPRLPAVATENTEEGAEATLEYFWEAIDYARLTGETQPLAMVSHESCEFCDEHIEGWQSRYQDGDWVAVHGSIDIDIRQTETHIDEKQADEWTEISFQLSEPAADLYINGTQNSEESLPEASVANWFADLSFDASSQRWMVEWLGIDDSDGEHEQ